MDQLIVVLLIILFVGRFIVAAVTEIKKKKRRRLPPDTEPDAPYLVLPSTMERPIRRQTGRPFLGKEGSSPQQEL